jgi:hypothetical protein
VVARGGTCTPALAARRSRADHAGVIEARQPSFHVPGLARAGRRVLTALLLGVLPATMVLAILVAGFHDGAGAWALDFKGNFVLPARDILHGVSPYDPAYLERVRAAVASGRASDEFSHGVFAAYPAPALLLGVPFTSLPAAVAEWLWAGLMAGSAMLALRVVGVRDWRVHGAALLTPALAASLAYGTVNGLLMLGLALLWRRRDQALRGGIALGALIALKLLFLPLLAWLLFTRRWRCAGIACAAAVALWLAGWAVIGFDGFTGYPHLLSVLAEIEQGQGFSSTAYARSVGLSELAPVVPYALGACVTGLAWVAVRREAANADAHGFLLMTLAVIAFAPIVWVHYLTLLLVPLAVLRPRLSTAWLVPSLLWVTPYAAYSPAGAAARIVFAVTVAGTVISALGPRELAAVLGAVPRARAGRMPAW